MSTSLRNDINLTTTARGISDAAAVSAAPHNLTTATARKTFSATLHHRDVVSVETFRSRDVLTSRLGSRVIASRRDVLCRRGRAYCSCSCSSS